MRTKEASRPPRVILDSNLVLSYFLPPVDPSRTIFRLIDHILRGSAQLVLPEELIDEIILVIRTKSYFRQRISEQGAQAALADLRVEADVPPRLSVVPGIARDAKDDYLLAHAILAGVDFLVTGDRDLLVLDGEIDRLRIVTAAEFLTMLDEARSDPE